MPKVEVFNKDYVLEQASNVFHLKGYNATSMQDLVDATGLNRSSIYNSFGNKLSLFLECLKNYQNKYSKITASTLIKSENSLEAIESIFNLYLSEILSDKDRKGCLITNCKSEMANQDLLINNFLNNNQEQTLQLFESLISQGQNEGLINKNQTAKNYSLFLFSSIQGFRMTGILINDKKQLQGIIKMTLQILN
ncbi:TetR/AcrR family transcriptional regulator [uncultured Lacinutrix sp.]|uniref:TetR/AcrR family transcriptional regulator n=1 Tax=uncultured Lacinutrix sp. TaxID=574032 RepID=UPI002639CAF5|nr:TetR/AcrR family transcriptional regulator [uncultured Lacinutrix sp.]